MWKTDGDLPGEILTFDCDLLDARRGLGLDWEFWVLSDTELTVRVDQNSSKTANKIAYLDCPVTRAHLENGRRHADQDYPMAAIGNEDSSSETR